MTIVKNAFGVSDQLGSGGTGLASDGGSGPSDGTPDIKGLLRLLLGACYTQYATAAAMTASLAANRKDGQQAIKVDDYTQWVWKAADATAADANHIVPTDVGAGAGRWVNIDGTGGGAGTAAQPTQFGTTAALVAGVSGTIAANLGANSKILLSRATVGASTALGELVPTNIATGTPGSFKVTAATLGTPGTPLAGDLSTVNWMIVG